MRAPTRSAHSRAGPPAARKPASRRKRRRAARRKRLTPAMPPRKAPSHARRRQKRPAKSPPPNKWRSPVSTITFHSIAPHYGRLIFSESRQPAFPVTRAAQDYYFENQIQ